MPRAVGDCSLSIYESSRNAAPHDSRIVQTPAYLEDFYWWAYLRPYSLRIFDHRCVVSAILWGQYNRLKQAVIDHIRDGERVLQAACVYGDLSLALARHVGPAGRLDVIDIVPLQVANCRHKLKGLSQATVWLADAAAPGGGVYDASCCFFLLHELPDDRKAAVVDGLLECVAPGGRAIFVDYHRPEPLHPLKPIMSLAFDLLEPFAKHLWLHEISEIATKRDLFDWRKGTSFGGLYQVVVAQRRQSHEQRSGCCPTQFP